MCTQSFRKASSPDAPKMFSGVAASSGMKSQQFTVAPASWSFLRGPLLAANGFAGVFGETEQGRTCEYPRLLTSLYYNDCLAMFFSSSGPNDSALPNLIWIDKSMATLHFRALIKIYGVNPYVLVSAQRASEIKPGWRKPMPVLVQVNGEPEEPASINMMPIGDGSFRLYLNGRVRKASSTGVGDRVDVILRFDAKYRSGPTHRMPIWFRAALRENPVARKNWDPLIPSRKKEILRYFSELKSSEARERNLARALRALSGEPARFMARSWSGN